MARALDRNRYRSLMLRTRPKFSPGLNLAALGKMPPQPGNVFVINFINLVEAESADLPARHESTATTAAATPSGAITTVTVAATPAAESRTAFAAAWSGAH